jgi:hypothetical protein
MPRLVRLVIAAFAAVSVWLAPAASAVAAGPVSRTMVMDSAACTSVLAALREQRSALSRANQYVLDHATPRNCRVTARTGNLRPSSSDALAGCTGFWATFHYAVYLGRFGFDYLQDHLNGGFCTSGSWVTRDWGPNCYVTTLVVWGWDTNWCGTYRPYGSGSLQMGHNFDVWPYPAPWWKKYGYSRLEVHPDFSYSTWGSCCG